jgi:OOP family OmpA-OmpF porin
MLARLALIVVSVAGSMATAHARTTKFDMDNGALKLPGPIYFEVNSDRIKPASEAALEVAYDFLDLHKDVALLRIEVHASIGGSPKANQALTEKRALAVARWLVAKGIECQRLVPVGFGDKRQGNVPDRRVSFVPVGGESPDGGGVPAGDPCHP